MGSCPMGTFKTAYQKLTEFWVSSKWSFSYLDKELFLLIYKSMVRPHLEYANSIWSPKLKKAVGSN